MKKKNPTLTDILKDFQSAYIKKAEEALPEEESAEAPVEDAAPEDDADEGMEYEDGGYEYPDDESPEESENVTATDLAEAAADVEAAENNTVDAAKELRDIADEYIDQHNDSLTKEAQVFGHIFAASAMNTWNTANSLDESEANAYLKTAAILQQTSEEEFLEKLAGVSEEAYDLAMVKLAEDMAYDATQPQVEEEPEDESEDASEEGCEECDNEGSTPEWLQKAVMETSEALNTQAETLNELAEDESEESEEDLEDAAAAEQAAYDNTAAALNEQVPSEEEVAQNAYNAAAQQIPQNLDQSDLGQVAANAYDAAAQQIQPQDQIYPQNLQ